MIRRLLYYPMVVTTLLLSMPGLADPADAFRQYCRDGACAQQAISRLELIEHFKALRKNADALEFYDRDIDHFRDKFLGYDKFTLEIRLQVSQSDANALAIRGQFTSWFDDDFTSLLKKDYVRTCMISSATPLICKIRDDRVLIWFDRKLALHLVELVYDAKLKHYKTRQHRVIRPKIS